MPIIMTSQTIVAKLYELLSEEIASLEDANITPTLAVVLVGEDPNSVTYVNIKGKQAGELGIEFSLHRLDDTASQESIIEAIEKLNAEPSVSGIIVQLPLPDQIDTDKVLQTVVKEKDVDGLRPDSDFTPPTVSAITELLQSYDISLEEKTIVVVGKGRLVGGPLIKRFKERNLDVTVCDESTGDLAACTINADILVSGTGEEHLIKPSMIKEGAVVIDVDKDVLYDEVQGKVGYITPQKGGVGPLTVAFLLSNVVDAAKKHAPKD